MPSTYLGQGFLSTNSAYTPGSLAPHPAQSIGMVMKSPGRNSLSVLPPDQEASGIRIWGTYWEPPGLAFSTELILQAHGLPTCVTLARLRSFTVLFIIRVAQANSSMLFGQVIEKTGTRPRHVSFKPTTSLNLQMGSVDSCLELLMLGCTDMFTYSSSVGRKGG